MSFADWAEAVFGNGLARHFMRHYNLQGLGTPAGDDEQRVDRRAGERRRPQACANQPSSGTGRGQLGPSNTFKYPLHGGTGGLFERFVPQIREHPRLNRALVQVDTEARRLRFADGSDDTYDLLITTLPIPELLRMLGPVSTRSLNAARGLRHSHGLVVGVGAAKSCTTSKCWAYFPEPDAPFYRESVGERHLLTRPVRRVVLREPDRGRPGRRLDMRRASARRSNELSAAAGALPDAGVGSSRCPAPGRAARWAAPDTRIPPPRRAARGRAAGLVAARELGAGKLAGRVAGARRRGAASAGRV